MTGNLFHAIQNRITRPGQVFLIVPGGPSHTYGDLVARSGRYANALSDLGVGKGDRVAVQTGKNPDCLWLYLACLRVGAIYLPLNPAYTTAEVEYFLQDAEPKVFVCETSQYDTAAPMVKAALVPCLETLDAEGSGSLQQRVCTAPEGYETLVLDGDDLAAILYTSGTTGRSKGAMISHRNLQSNAEALADIWRFTGKDVLLNALPIFHTHGLFVATNTVLMSGAAMVFLERFDLDEVIAQLPGATTMMGVPTFYIRLLSDARFNAELVSGLRLFISGSAPLSADIHRQFFARTGHAILERYGMTETNMITSNPYDGERVPGAVGFPLPGVDLRIADPETGRPLPRGDIGVIELKGPNVFKGYWRLPDKTAEDFRADGFFTTGDLGYIDPQGYVTISGRDKDLIISGGFNVYPAEIEKLLDAQNEVAEAAVIGVPHPDFGEGVVGIVVTAHGRRIDEAAIRARMGNQLARFKVPKRIIAVDQLPRNTMGKIQKNLLRETYAGLFSPGQTQIQE